MTKDFKSHKEEIREIKKPDAFVVKGRTVVDQIVSHWGSAAVVVGILLLAYLGNVFYQSQKEKKSNLAFAKYYQTNKVSEKYKENIAEQNQLKSQIKQAEQALQELSSKATSDVKDIANKKEELETAQKKLAENLGKTEELKKQEISALEELLKQAQDLTPIVISLAKQDLAQVYIQDKKYDEALQLLLEAASLKEVSDLVQSVVLSQISFCYEEKQDYANALQNIEKALTLKENFSKPELLMSKARILRLQSQNDKAKEIYQQIIKDFVGTEFETKSQQFIDLMALQ